MFRTPGGVPPVPAGGALQGLDDSGFDALVADRDKRGRLRRGGLKMTLDGSIQGYTAFLSEPHHVQPEGSSRRSRACAATSRGPICAPSSSTPRRCARTSWTSPPSMASRPRSSRSKSTSGATVTRELFLDPERAARISPARTALDRGIKITLHHDAPIAGIEMLTVAWSAVNRVTTGGEELGPEHRITPFEGLRAITADAAWQNREEDRKGTLEAGKLADLVVLSEDPLAVDPMKIKDVQVLETIKEGETIYRL